jgi:hypothetical protein
MTDEEREELAKKLYELKLFDVLHVYAEKDDQWYTRVPGGWIHSDACGNSVFIPFDSEFDPKAN